jgi:hypothetical protein
MLYPDPRRHYHCLLPQLRARSLGQLQVLFFHPVYLLHGDWRSAGAESGGLPLHLAAPPPGRPAPHLPTLTHRPIECYGCRAVRAADFAGGCRVCQHWMGTSDGPVRSLLSCHLDVPDSGKGALVAEEEIFNPGLG